MITDYENNRLDEIAGSGFDLAVIDLAMDAVGSKIGTTTNVVTGIQLAFIVRTTIAGRCTGVPTKSVQAYSVGSTAIAINRALFGAIAFMPPELKAPWGITIGQTIVGSLAGTTCCFLTRYTGRRATRLIAV